MKRAITSLLLATSALTAAQLAGAADGVYTPPHLVVNYSGVELATIEGVKDLYDRMHRAAEHVCNDLDGPNLSLRYACVHGAVSKAVQSVNSPLLTAYHIRREVGYEPVTVAAAK
jgi:UrcA family protein